MTLPLLIVSSFYPSWFFGVPLLSEDLEDFKSGSSTSVLIASNKSADLGLRPNCIPRALVDGAGGVEERLCNGGQLLSKLTCHLSFCYLT